MILSSALLRHLQRSIGATLVGLALAFSSAVASENVAPAPGTEKSFLDRYRNNVQDLLLRGLELAGVRYRWGGTDPNSGLDCSGFVQLVFKDAVSFKLPRTAKEMSGVGEHIEKTELKPGDLVFFNTLRRPFSHVGIYVGDNQFMHSPRAGSEVKIENMEAKYWVQRYNGARRIVSQ